MKLIGAAGYDDLSRRAADLVLAQTRAKPESLLVLPTGNTPLGMFRALVDAQRSGRADLRGIRFAMLDEYAGIGPDDRRSLYQWLRRDLFDPLGVSPDSVIVFDSTAEPEAEARRVEAAIAAHGGIDLAVLGLGPNGHLAMNEPGSPFDSRTRLVALAPESIRSNAAYWGSEADVPRTGMTLGLGTLAEARSALLLVSGAAKAGILDLTVNGPVTADIPATFLRLHADCTVIADSQALVAG